MPVCAEVGVPIRVKVDVADSRSGRIGDVHHRQHGTLRWPLAETRRVEADTVIAE